MPLLLQREVELLMKVGTESLKDELSEFESIMMIKSSEIQRLQKENNLVKKKMKKKR